MRKFKNILVTGGAGFIGSNFIHYLFGLSHSNTDFFNDAAFSGNVINLDKLTYASNINNLSDVEEKFGKGSSLQRYFFEKVDICDRKEVERIFNQYNIDAVVHFAAESHVDRSITEPDTFIMTNVMGTFTLLDVARNYWNISLDNIRQDVLFHHISTDEVYGSLDKSGYFVEETAYSPRSPYSASKASSDHLVMSYFHTYGLPVTISNCSNNYGPFQHTEKLIPLIINNIRCGKPLPVYGTGKNIRDWIYVEDHNRGVWQIMQNAASGSKWNLGGQNEWQNIELINKIIKLCSQELNMPEEKIRSTVQYIKDRPGHDFRYAIDCTKAKSELGWERKMSFEQGLQVTVQWYLKNSTVQS